MARKDRSRSRTKEAPGQGAGARRPGAGSRPTTGRVTPKGSHRYTPPIPREEKVSPKWVPVLMFTLLILGMLIIIANYLGLLPGDAKNSYLFVGLGLITAGFITATKYR
ncbi:MAG: cell division protein CrgA [Acidimicrobiales bacterium]